MRSILVIEDETDVAAVIEAVLKRDQFHVECATSRDEALKKINDGYTPNAIVMDCMMPGMSADAFLALVRQQQPTIPVILQTAAPDGLEKAQRLDAFYIAKPWKIDILSALIGQVVK